MHKHLHESAVSLPDELTKAVTGRGTTTGAVGGGPVA